MSSRRAVGEDNILAMLERDSARRNGTRASNLRLACYGAAAAFAGIVVGGVAWLAYDNHKTASQLQAGHDTVVAAPPAAINAEALPQPAPPMLTAPPPAPVAAAAPPAANPRAAMIVDEAAPAARTASSDVPPLVMLPPTEAPAAKPAPRPAKKITIEKEKESVATIPVKPRAAPSAAGGGSEKKVDRKATRSTDKAQRSAARAAKPAPRRNAAKAAADAPRQRKAAAAVASAASAAQPDTDVALISAIISQSERHRGEREDAVACKGATCPPKPAQP